MKKIFTLILLCSSLVNAQTYDFSITPAEGCAPLNFTITNLCNDPNAYYYQWVFIGPSPTHDTLYIIDTLTVSVSGVLNFSDTGQVVIFMSVYDSNYNYIASGISNKEIFLRTNEINLSATPDICFSGTGTATASGCCGNPPYTYAWSDGSTTPAITGLSSGTYTASVTNFYGCMAVDSVEVADHANNIFSGLENTPDTCSAGVGAASSSPSGGAEPYSYAWSNGSHSQSIDGISAGTYFITITDQYNCITTDSTIVGTSVFVLPADICIVTVDNATGKNKIVWEEINDSKIVSYNIYKETSTAGVYSLVGNTPVSSLTTFTDSLSNPAQVAARYTISAMDSCGNESQISNPHKTIHLTIGLGLPPAINLSWDNYEGISYNKYYIWRGNSTGNMAIIDSVQGTLTSYTDLTPPPGNNYYAIQVKHSSDCTASLQKSETYSSSFSNIEGYVSLNAAPGSFRAQINITPNPSDGEFRLEFLKQTNGPVQVAIMDVLGKKIRECTKEGKNDIIIDLTGFPEGVYYLTVTGENYTFYRKLMKQ